MGPMFTALAGDSLLLSHQGSPFWTTFEATFSGSAQNSQFIPHKTLHTLWGCFMYPSFISSVTVSSLSLYIYRKTERMSDWFCFFGEP